MGAIASLPIPAATIPNRQLNVQPQQVMDEAIEDRYRVRALYRAIIHEFGTLRPFSNLICTEGWYVRLWNALLRQYGLAKPNDTFAKKVKVPATLQVAFQGSIANDMTNLALSNRCLSFA